MPVLNSPLRPQVQRGSTPSLPEMFGYYSRIVSKLSTKDRENFIKYATDLLPGDGAPILMRQLGMSEEAAKRFFDDFRELEKWNRLAAAGDGRMAPNAVKWYNEEFLNKRPQWRENIDWSNEASVANLFDGHFGTSNQSISRLWNMPPGTNFETWTQSDWSKYPPAGSTQPVDPRTNRPIKPDGTVTSEREIEGFTGSDQPVNMGPPLAGATPGAAGPTGLATTNIPGTGNPGGGSTVGGLVAGGNQNAGATAGAVGGQYTPPPGGAASGGTPQSVNPQDLVARIQAFIDRVTSRVGPDDPIYQGLMQVGTDAAQRSAAQRGISGGISGAMESQASRQALLPYLREREQLGLKGMEILGGLQNSLADQALRADQLAMNRQMNQYQQDFNTLQYNNQVGQANWAAQNQFNQSRNPWSLIGGGLGAVGDAVLGAFGVRTGGALSGLGSGLGGLGAPATQPTPIKPYTPSGGGVA